MPQLPASMIPEELEFLAGGGEMGALIRAHDWASTVIGTPSGWPQSLRTAVRVMLSTRHPVYIFWGPQLLCFYNDAYRPSLGPERHPGSLGQPGRTVWTEIWDDIGSQVDQVMSGGEATWNENQMLRMTRNGRIDDVYWTYSYGPIDEPSSRTGVGGVLVLCTETTSTVMAEKRRGEQADRQQQVFKQAPGFVIVMRGKEHRVEFLNDEYLRLFGGHNWLGMPIREAFPDAEGQGFFELLDGVFASGVAHQAKNASIQFRRASDEIWETRTVDFIYAPILDEMNQSTGIFCQGVDVTGQRAAEAALLQSEEQLRLAVEAADLGLWDVDLVSDTMYWPPRVKAMFGISADVQVSMEDFYDGVHPEDRAHTFQAFSDATNPITRSLYDVEYRTVGKEDGIVRWVAAKGRGIFDETGKCVRALGTVIEISRRKLAETRLALSEAKLRDNDRKKDEFLATLAHELRNPLSPIRNASKILQLPNIDGASTAKMGKLIERQSVAMASLLDELLDVARISQGKIVLKPSIASVLSLAEAALETVRPSIDAKRHQLRLEMECADTLLEVDSLRLAQVLTNLLHNAAKYTDSGGTIVLRAEASDEDVAFDVIDNGIGIAADDMPGLFEMFAQVERGLGRAQGGLGIGLALSRKLVELHGGLLTAHSDGNGHGSRFRVCLPKAKRAAKGSTASSSTSHAREPVSAPKLLVVDDNADAADTLGALLESAGYRVAIAYEARVALTIAQEEHPFACLVDIGMPGMDGFELASRLRRLSPVESMLLVATTGWGQEQDRLRAIEAGFDAHMTKPVDFDGLCELLRQREMTGE